VIVSELSRMPAHRGVLPAGILSQLLTIRGGVFGEQVATEHSQDEEPREYRGGLDRSPRGVKTASPRAWSWAALMHRAFGIDVLACPHCGGRLRLIATLHDPAVIRKILAHLALGHSGQSPGPAPPESGAAAS
jgi:hypothetical protein